MTIPTLNSMTITLDEGEAGNALLSKVLTPEAYDTIPPVERIIEFEHDGDVIHITVEFEEEGKSA